MCRSGINGSFTFLDVSLEGNDSEEPGMIAFLILSVMSGLLCMGIMAALGAGGWAIALWYVAGCWIGALTALAILILMRSSSRRVHDDLQAVRPFSVNR